MKFYKRLATVVLAIVTVITIAFFHTFVLAFPEHEVDAIASQTTVLIAPALQEGDAKARREWETGSGAIVARKGKSYYALTALSVVQTRGFYGVRTSDGKVHLVEHNEDNSSIYPLGREDGELRTRAKDLDLALVKFESEHDYPVAAVGDAEKLRNKDVLYVSGWPVPQNQAPRRERITQATSLNQIDSQPHSESGYSLAYNIQTRQGMDGGPVFSKDGLVVAIHGSDRSQEHGYCLEPKLSGNNSCGLPISRILNAIEAEDMRLSFDRGSVDPKLIARGLANKSTADVIPDVYKLFTFDLDAMLRNKPSLGCGSILLGDKCPRSSM
ncbi:MAG: trypsin-like peptidase domain-containing protein [Chlorogloeopsis fritschii C42_A2020_084]|uniref:S1 family peptidase n=1 Tax=Chlorogloeopsis fritschii TaxID=1124 RepID=UPI0019EA3B87|nr:serine protease [Chlorogloeopsis fritschii]MBF2006930.1 trypsin-like peptidase domain-containing protein [Chlorogloeopsis fritschii C42_A2020_084]